MRILAIRGKNLASLAGRFALDFTAGPLAQTRLFAITGPTGAGKSTLLDALCLALFDRTPRLDDRGGALIGREGEDERWKVRSTDVRSLLSRGAAEGLAEVDFVGRDGRSYRATWSVRRARGKVGGRLQDQELTLVDLDSGQLLGGRKGETLAATRERLGLTFDQFRQSVLLAQGEFARFLKADADGRSELLQRMTGTELYERISRAAFARAKAARERVSLAEASLARIPVLPDEDRAALEVEGRVAASDEAAAARELESLASVARAEEARAAATSALADAERTRAERAEAEAAARAARATAEEGHRAAAGRAAKVQGERERLAPELARARETDARLGQARAELEAARREADEAAARSDEAARAAGAAGEEERRTALRLDELSLWLTANGAALTLAERRDAWERALDELVLVLRGRQAASERLPELGERERRGREALAGADEALATLALRLAAAEEARRAAEESRAAVPLATLQEERARAEARREALARLAETRRRAAEAEAARAKAEGAALEAARDAEAARAEEGGARLAAAHAGIALDEARRALRAAEAARDLAPRRSELVEATPCPLCGATEHPWARHAAPDDGLLAALGTRVAALDAERGEADRRAAAASAREAAERGRSTEAAGDAAEAARRLAEARAAWASGREPLAAEALPVDVLDAAAEQALARAAARARAAVDEAGARLSGAAALEDAARRAREAEGTLLRAREEAGERRSRAEKALLEGTRAREEVVAALSALARTEEREREALAPFLAGRPGSGELSATRPQDLRAALAAEADDYRRKETEAAGARTALAAASAAAATARRLAEERAVAAGRAEAEASRRCLAVEALAAARSALLSGRGVAEVDAGLAGAEAEAASALEEARLAGTAAALDLERAAAGRAHAEEAEGALRRALDAAGAALTAALARSGLPSVEALGPRLEEASRRREAAQERRTAAEVRRRQDDESRTQRAEAEAAAASERKGAEVWVTLSGLVGHADGVAFRRFAQGVTLDALVSLANRHLADLSRRYLLSRVPGTDMDLMVVDRDMGDEPRSVHSLSGGETFLVSLALALGLSSLATRRTRVESLFVDEGFGLLDPDTLDTALSALEALQHTGRRIGVISHVGGLAERIGVRVAVTPRGGGRSTVTVETAWG